MNGISKELQNMIPKFKEGEMFEFELIGLKESRDHTGRRGKIIPSKVIVPSSCSIYDPGDQSTKTISLINQVIPSSPGREEKIILGKVSFIKSEAGRKIIHGRDKGKMNLYEYLYLCTWNRANRGQPWHIPPNRGEYKFTYVDRDNKKKADLDKRKQRIKAQSIAFDLSEKELRILCEKLSTEKNAVADFNYDNTWSESETRERLASFAEKYSGLVISKHKEYNMAIERLVRDALSNGIIKHDKAKKQIVWGKGGNLIVEVPQRKKPSDVLSGYFMTKEGKDDLEAIVAQMKNPEPVSEPE